MINYGIIFKERSISTTGKLAGKVICFTGIRDKEFTNYLEDNGATVTENFTKNVTILIAKDPDSNSSKIIKAKKQNCEILSLEKAKLLFKGE
ncbi:MAG: BRCT domain-containing protein [Bacilli bacterium]|nr:BRCT domain-containing protein [Bacilli bacterium]